MRGTRRGRPQRRAAGVIAALYQVLRGANKVKVGMGLQLCPESRLNPG